MRSKKQFFKKKEGRRDESEFRKPTLQKKKQHGQMKEMERIHDLLDFEMSIVRKNRENK